ncbi:MAG: hypothetical protein ACOYJQ_00420 [Pseudochelatococcus sp.]|jgi:hypothetical protein|uniref:hypothetical protein n=1 Tax=Pseudochelatococcus sp. TaxID=2020869 RepID=UPI003D91FA19
MIGWRFEPGALSDLSATIFSVFLLLLVALLDAMPTPDAQPATIERRPAGAAEMADLLHRRRPDAPGTGIDVLAARYVISAAPALPLHADTAAAIAETPVSLADVANALRAGRLPEPIRLYVFAHDGYDNLTALLQAHGRGWTEMNVPDALKEKTADRPPHWSPAFRQILARAATREQFLRELARLLSGHGARRGQADRLSETLPAPAMASRSSTMRLQDSAWRGEWIEAIAGLLAIAAGMAVVVAVEHRTRSGSAAHAHGMRAEAEDADYR